MPLSKSATQEREVDSPSRRAAAGADRLHVRRPPPEPRRVYPKLDATFSSCDDGQFESKELKTKKEGRLREGTFSWAMTVAGEEDEENAGLGTLGRWVGGQMGARGKRVKETKVR